VVETFITICAAGEGGGMEIAMNKKHSVRMHSSRHGILLLRNTVHARRISKANSLYPMCYAILVTILIKVVRYIV